MMNAKHNDNNQKSSIHSPNPSSPTQYFPTNVTCNASFAIARSSFHALGCEEQAAIIRTVDANLAEAAAEEEEPIVYSHGSYSQRATYIHEQSLGQVGDVETATNARHSILHQAPDSRSDGRHSRRLEQQNTNQNKPVYRATEEIEERDLCDKEDSESKGRKTTSYRECIVVSGLLILIGAVLLWIFVLRDGSANDGSMAPEEQKTPDQTSVGVDDAQSVLLIRTVSPTSPPTGMGPSVLSLEDYVMALLPNSTQQTIAEHKYSPQALAYSFVTDYPSLSTLVATEQYPDQRVVQRFAMACFYYATDGPHWIQNLNWVEYDHHECDWFISEINNDRIDMCTPMKNVDGKTDNNNRGSVTSLHLWANELHGELPSEFYLLTDLKSVILTANRLQGTISSALISKLSKLSTLSMAANEITGTLPHSIALLADDLSHLHLSLNRISGVIPTEIGWLSRLSFFQTDQNAMTGALPTELGQLTAMQKLHLNDNSFSGSIPSQLALLTKLEQLYLSENVLSSALPSELGQLSLLEHLVVSNNDVTGSLFTELGELSLLTLLSLYQNSLAGNIPSELGVLASLDQLYLELNQLTGIPSELGQLTEALHNLDISSNMIRGRLPSELGLCQSLSLFRANDNLMTGTIPAEIAGLASASVESSLYRFNISNNNFSGTVPQELCSLGSSVLGFDCSSSLCGCWCLCSYTF